jgi:molybdopterin/thiamine biosynthesis adenylyltransferase
MSSGLIDLNEDLKKLRSKGYNIDIHNGHLVVRDIPYVCNDGSVKVDGMLVTELELSGDRTIAPSRHQIRFIGQCPCDRNSNKMDSVRPNEQRFKISAVLETDFELSNKPPGGYKDYYEKITNYTSLISGPASTIDPSTSPMTNRVVEPGEDESPFNYLDTASTRAEIGMISEKLAVNKVAIVGLGGSGSYVLDLIAKTPVKEIHLFDGDKFNSHNAFRAPGAASVDELRKQPLKVEYFKGIYEKMHRGIIAHPEFISEANVDQLLEMNCVFLCVDAGPGKRTVVETLAPTEVPFIDASMGLIEHNESLRGIIAVRASTSNNRDEAKDKMNLDDTDEANEYERNIQVADLNALAAQLAVMRWKKMRGFYTDRNGYNYYTYTIASGRLDLEPSKDNNDE